MIEFLSWDSHFFGIQIAKISLFSQEDWNELMDKGAFSQYGLAYIFDYSLSKPTLGDAIKVDTKVTFQKRIGLIPSWPHKVQECQTNVPYENLYQLAIISGEYSRFSRDKQFPIGSFERLYHKWVDNSVERIIADSILVYYDEDTIHGFITVKIENGQGHIGLLAVYPESQGKGIGTQLLLAAECFFIHRDIGIVCVDTQLENEKACNFYIKNGFEEKVKTNIYHLWL